MGAVERMHHAFMHSACRCNETVAHPAQHQIAEACTRRLPKLGPAQHWRARAAKLAASWAYGTACCMRQSACWEPPDLRHSAP